MAHIGSYLGIDPGMGGGIAVVGDCVEAHKMPATERDTWDLIQALKSRHNILYALIEELHALPAAVEEKLGIKRGSIAQAKLMRHYGGLRMALIAAGIRFEERIPQVWQKVMNCRTGGNKNVSKAKAQQLFPAIKVTHAIADALLIASTARILWMNSHSEIPQAESSRIYRAPADPSPSVEHLELRALGMGA
ncbi:MAG: hypothetical protein QUT30_03120 [Acidobacteriota bacterium]|nr:hypothetical protein [Acidobacteriota bacterium]